MSQTQGLRRLGVFAKHWTPGRVKTRLASAVGEQTAADLHKEFLRTLLSRFDAIADERVLFFTPSDSLAEFLELTCCWTLHAQIDGDLGQRMDHFFRQGFAGGADKVVLIGADSPSMPVQFVQQAFEELDEHDVVLGPSEDGGYYLIGARGAAPQVFLGVDWGSGKVLQQTQDILRQSATPHALLPEWFDVDHYPELQRLARELRNTDDSNLASLGQVVQQVVDSNDQQSSTQQ